MEPKAKPSNTGTKTLSKNRFLELLTRTHISITLVLYTTLPAFLLYYGFQHQYITVTSTAVLFLLGILTFTLIEYIIHRYIFHIEPSTPARAKFVKLVHGAHHEYPKDKDRISMPPLPSIILAVSFFALFRLLLGTYVFGFLPGFFIGYLLYSSIHYAVHAYQPPRNFLKILWVHHGIHHYKDPEHAFGVSTPFWDMFFRTMPKKQ